MCHLILPRMSANGRGAIVNLSSYCCDFPWPFNTMYSSSKSFVDHFTTSLSYEYESRGLTIQSLTPCGVTTKMLEKATDEKDSNILQPTPERYASWAINTLGVSSRTTGFWGHGMLSGIFGFFPKSLLIKGMKHMSEQLKLKNDKHK